MISAHTILVISELHIDIINFVDTKDPKATYQWSYSISEYSELADRLAVSLLLGDGDIGSVQILMGTVMLTLVIPLTQVQLTCVTVMPVHEPFATTISSHLPSPSACSIMIDASRNLFVTLRNQVHSLGSAVGDDNVQDWISYWLLDSPRGFKIPLDHTHGMRTHTIWYDPWIAKTMLPVAFKPGEVGQTSDRPDNKTHILVLDLLDCNMG
jgi:hypothetical protein